MNFRDAGALIRKQLLRKSRSNLAHVRSLAAYFDLHWENLAAQRTGRAPYELVMAGFLGTRNSENNTSGIRDRCRSEGYGRDAFAE